MTDDRSREDVLNAAIKRLREDGWRVTAYDRGREIVDFCLAVRVGEPVDIWYVRGSIPNEVPMYDERQRILYFPRLVLDEQSFGEVINGAN